MRFLLALGAACWFVVCGAGTAIGQPVPDSSTVATPAEPDAVRDRTPRGAVTRALAVPGWGQVYNRQPLKAPIAAAAVVGSIVFAVSRQQQYFLFRRATFYAGCLQPPDRPEVCTAEALAEAEDEYERLSTPTRPATFAQLAPLRDRARGQRDISVLVVGVAYAFQALDAYVAAELADFDVSEDLSLHVVPRADGTALTLRLQL